VCSRRGAIQIHVYLYLYLYIPDFQPVKMCPNAQRVVLKWESGWGQPPQYVVAPTRTPTLKPLAAPPVVREKIVVYSINARQRSSCHFITFNVSADSQLRPIGDGAAAAERHSTSAVTRYDVANARIRALFHTLPLASVRIRSFLPHVLHPLPGHFPRKKLLMMPLWG